MRLKTLFILVFLFPLISKSREYKEQGYVYSCPCYEQIIEPEEDGTRTLYHLRKEIVVVIDNHISHFMADRNKHIDLKNRIIKRCKYDFPQYDFPDKTIETNLQNCKFIYIMMYRK